MCRSGGKKGFAVVGGGEHGGGEIYRFYTSGSTEVSCGGARELRGCMARENGVLPEEVSKAYTGRRERLAITVGETEGVTLLPCALSWRGSRPCNSFFYLSNWVYCGL